MRTVIIGGTYNPVHIGHLHLAEETRLQFGYERVIFVPANIPAHKESDSCTSPRQRLEMLKRATESSGIVVDTTEIERGGVSYTYETVLEFFKKYDITGKPGLVVGDDLVPGLSKWREWDKLLPLIDLLIAHRLHKHHVQCPYPHSYVDNLMLPISSSQIRQRVKHGRGFRYLVPEEVARYIDEREMYRRC
ncbi:MAG TPA: nicotinate (nicotinamide) nucleotide adenylyltransferase [Sediminispirochaeta sp.]|nr:nicotinate (nicotinamide) nucleotide adenylyltransferase [Sediminispirochaeta sp.]